VVEIFFRQKFVIERHCRFSFGVNVDEGAADYVVTVSITV